MSRIRVVAYGVLCYFIFLASFLYAIGFVANLVVPKGIDDGTSESVTLAAIIDLGLLSLFAVLSSIRHAKSVRPVLDAGDVGSATSLGIR
jgi:hypothetical protein